MVGKISSIFVLVLFTISFVMAGAGTGMDETFDYLGLDKPTDWDSWSRDEKFSWMQDRGIYPESGGKYKGNADTSKFFSEYLGVEQPADWDSLSFEEKAEFNDETLNPAEPESFRNPLNEEPQDLPENSEENIVDADILEVGKERSWQLWTVIVMSLLIVLGGFFHGDNKFRKVVGWFALYILPIILILLALFYGGKELYLEMGHWAEYLLIFLLLIKPVAMILNVGFLKKPCSYRQELGMAVFWLFIVHAVGFWLLYNMGFGDFVRPQVIWGTVATIALLIGAVTSNKASMKLLKKNWKKVQMIAYVALLGTLLHTSIVADNMLKFYIIFGVFAILKILEWKDVRLFGKKDTD